MLRWLGIPPITLTQQTEAPAGEQLLTTGALFYPPQADPVGSGVKLELSLSNKSLSRRSCPPAQTELLPANFTVRSLLPSATSAALCP